VSNKLYPIVYLSSTKTASAFLFAGAEIVARPFSRYTFKPKITNWRLPDQTSPVAEALLNTDGETLLNTDGESLFNTGS